MYVFIALILPIALVVIEICFVVVVRHINFTTSPGSLLALKSIKYGIVGVALSLALTIAWMLGYECLTGYNAGNAPLGWILFYGPISFALGQIVALGRWWKNIL